MELGPGGDSFNLAQNSIPYDEGTRRDLVIHGQKECDEQNQSLSLFKVSFNIVEPLVIERHARRLTI